METKKLDWWDSSIEEFVSPHLLEEGKTAAESWEKGKDTMDVWFDSGTSWSMLSEMGVGNNRDKGDGVGRQFDADLCLEGSDQHRGWFQSQLLTALGSAPPGQSPIFSPYGALMTHGMVLDEKGKKMSKSLGNIVGPMTIVNGSDSVGFLVQSAVIKSLTIWCRTRQKSLMVPMSYDCGLPRSNIGKMYLLVEPSLLKWQNHFESYATLHDFVLQILVLLMPWRKWREFLKLGWVTCVV
jgi:valyl-tRNA synthetase